MPVNIQPLFDKIMKDPDVVPEEGQEKSDIAISMVLQRAKQSVNNERVLNFVNEPEDFVTKLMDFITIKKANPDQGGKISPEGLKIARDKGYNSQQIIGAMRNATDVKHMHTEAENWENIPEKDRVPSDTEDEEGNAKNYDAELDAVIEDLPKGDVRRKGGQAPSERTVSGADKKEVTQLQRSLAPRLVNDDMLQTTYDDEVGKLNDLEEGSDSHKQSLLMIQAIADEAHSRKLTISNPDDKYPLPSPTTVTEATKREAAAQEKADTQAIKRNPSQLPKFLHTKAFTGEKVDRHFTRDQTYEILEGADEDETDKRMASIEKYIRPMMKQHEINTSKRTGRAIEEQERDDFTLADHQQWLGTAAKDDDGNIVRDKNGNIDLEHVMERLHGFGVQIAKERDDLEADSYQVGSARHGKRDWDPTSEHKDDVKRLQDVRKQIGLPSGMDMKTYWQPGTKATPTPKAKTPSTPPPKAATPPPTKTSKKKTPTADESQAKGIVDAPVPAKTISDDARQHLKDVAGLSDEQIDTGIEAGDYHTKAGRRRSLTNIKQNFPAPPKEEDKKEDTTTAVGGTKEQPQGTLFDDTDAEEEGVSDVDQQKIAKKKAIKDAAKAQTEAENAAKAAEDAETEADRVKTAKEAEEKAAPTVANLAEKLGLTEERLQGLIDHHQGENDILYPTKDKYLEFLNGLDETKQRDKLQAIQKVVNAAKKAEDSQKVNQKSKENAEADKAANDIGQDPKEWDKHSAIERYRDVMHHAAGHDEKRITDKTKEALIGAAQRAAQKMTQSDLDSVNKIIKEHTAGDTPEARKQNWDKYKNSDQYQQDIDNHRTSLKRDGDHDDLLSGQAGREARGEAFKNNDSNRLIHSDENGNASHSELMHPNFKDGRKKVKESDETIGASSHIDDHEEVHGGSGRGEDGERILDKHPPDWNKDETAPQSSILSETEKDKQRIDRGQPPGPPPEAGLVWAAGIHHWVSPDKLSELQSGSGGLGDGEAHYVPPHQVQALLGHDNVDTSAAHADGTTGHQGGVFVTQHGLHRATDHTGTPDSLAHNLGANASHGSAPDLASASLGHAANKLGLAAQGEDGNVEHKDYHPDTHKIDKKTMDSTGINDHIDKAKAPAPQGSSQYMDRVKDSATSDSNLNTSKGRFNAIRNKLQSASKKAGSNISGAAGQAYADFMGDRMDVNPLKIFGRTLKEGAKGIGLTAAQAAQVDKEGAITRTLRGMDDRAKKKKMTYRQGYKERIAFGQGGMKDALQRSSKTPTEVEKFIDWQYK